MTVTLIVSGIVAPALFWIGYFYYKDRIKPEPLLNIAITYLLGFAAAYVCYKSYGLLPLLGLPEDASLIMDCNRRLFLVYCLGPVGVLEEFLKFLPFILVVIRFNAFDERVDGIIYACVIALGFASYENFHYLPLLEGFTLFGRAIASPLLHTIFASIWGYYAGTAYLAYKSAKSLKSTTPFMLTRARRNVRKASIKGLVIAFLLHGIFDFLTTSPALRILSAGVILVIWIWRLHRIEKLNKEDNAQPKKVPGTAAEAETGSHKQ